jgi:benzodiazapine receptor
VLFGRKRLDAATGVTAAMLASSVGSVVAARRVDERASLAFLPLAAWVAFATVLQEEVWRRNS